MMHVGYPGVTVGYVFRGRFFYAEAGPDGARACGGGMKGGEWDKEYDMKPLINDRIRAFGFVLRQDMRRGIVR